jgi:hypothetical protein
MIKYVSLPLLPDGRFSGQITQNRPEKNISGRKKLVAVRPPILLKSCRKQAVKNYFISSRSNIFRPQTRRVSPQKKRGDYVRNNER